MRKYQETPKSKFYELTWPTSNALFRNKSGNINAPECLNAKSILVAAQPSPHVFRGVVDDIQNLTGDDMTIPDGDGRIYANLGVEPLSKRLCVLTLDIENDIILKCIAPDVCIWIYSANVQQFAIYRKRRLYVVVNFGDERHFLLSIEKADLAACGIGELKRGAVLL